MLTIELKSKKITYSIYGAMIGLFTVIGVMIGEILSHEMAFTIAAVIDYQRNNPAFWFIDTAPIFFALIGAWLGNREDKINSLSEQLLQEKEFFESLVNNSPLAIATLDAEHKILDINPAFEDLFGYLEKDVVGKNLDKLMTSESSYSEATDLTQRAIAGESFQLISQRKRKDGSFVDVEIHGVPVFLGGKQIGALGLYSDVTERLRLDSELKELLEKADRLARTDVLTGLLNRRAIQEVAMAELSRSKREKTPLCLMLIDLDRLKEINDNYGHQAGDQAILHVARSLEKGKRSYDSVGRWGGDEMMLVLPNTKLKDAEMVANRLCQLVTEDSEAIETKIIEQMSISVGIAESTEEIRANSDIDQLFARADQALYDAKELGGGQTISHKIQKGFDGFT